MISDTKEEGDQSAGDVVLGRAKTAEDSNYADVSVDELFFWNQALGPAVARELYNMHSDQTPAFQASSVKPQQDSTSPLYPEQESTSPLHPQQESIAQPPTRPPAPKSVFGWA